MRLVVQRVLKAQVFVNFKQVGAIDQGAVALLGINNQDTHKKVPYLVKKLSQLRIFPNAQGKMDFSLVDLKLELLIISQFTLYADCISGRRPSFLQAACPDVAKSLYEAFIDQMQNLLSVQTGIFGADMKLHLINDGPVTFILDH
ncbi:D-aminoacyl-tRNA deacylase [Candidatus Rhabdochlamydia porcellionis]|jgi:D-aminoacyl-tRNA deacylase|uniref:D-aminoacyl-tRNA deacylase n=1 Tax=Candidatus Rhabdochlamydia porcellionis TaxID=225148 RepID=A0ABX8Z1E5_9BACT|nr:D-aminoacyl-tRNA deacylase [Candidatus Rhabdochlamydia porcellionis]QZA59195.1 D-aminoacyl-tRNA deacylase [Candidatus Rhabdochlamydia porcellionis]